jgi:hypothetical protein
MGGLLNALFFSPRYLKARAEMVANPMFYAQLPKGTRKYVAKSMVGFVGFWGMLLFLGYLAGAEVELFDADDPDWLKLRWGKYHYDSGAAFGLLKRYFETR